MYVNIYLKQAITPNSFITQRKYRNTKTSTISQTIWQINILNSQLYGGPNI